MSDATIDPTLDRLLRHMAWANAGLIERLAECSDEALALASPRNEWTVAMILQHLVDAADRYAARLEGVPRPERHRAADDGGRARGARRSVCRLRRPDPRTGRRAGRAGPVTRPGSARSGALDDRRTRPSTTPPSIEPRSPAPWRRMASTRSTSTPSTSGPTATRRASGPRRSPAAARPNTRRDRSAR